jgi:hypothetical protein
MAFPARLHALLASEAPVGVVFRRGPANTVCSILWNRERDEFQVGQWLRARLYERRSDISPDGRHMIYFVGKATSSWTAISKTPWLKAVVFFEKGDRWQGGGLFTSSSKYWVNGCHSSVRDESKLKEDVKFRPKGGHGAECLSVYDPRLLRDGWTLKEQTRGQAIFEKALPQGWTLRKYAFADVRHPQGAGCYWDEHELERGETRLLMPKWEWADLDRDTVVWAEGGCLHRAPVLKKGLGPPKVLFDFNPLKFERREAPY